MNLEEQIPESWDRYEAMKFISDRIKSDTKAFSVTVTSIRMFDNFGKKSILLHFNKRMTTSRNGVINPDITYIIDYQIVDNHMKISMRDDKINTIINE